MYIETNNDPKCWAKNHGCLEGLEIKSEVEKLEIFLVRLRATRLPKRHKSSFHHCPMERCALQSNTVCSLNIDLSPLTLRAAGAPILPQSFRTSSLVMYLCFLVDSNNLMYI